MGWLGDTDVTAATVAQSQQQAEQFALEQAIAAAVAAYAATVWINYYNEVDDGMEILQGFLDRQKDIADCFFDIYVGTTWANQRKAYAKIEQERIPQLSCQTALRKWTNVANAGLANIYEFENIYRRQFCLPQEPNCDHELEITRTVAAVSAAEQDREFTLRRAESIEELKCQALMRVVVSMQVNPSGINDLLNNATSLQQGLINGAAGIAQGAGTAFGSALNIAVGR